jgi:hypothetical protein
MSAVSPPPAPIPPPPTQPAARKESSPTWLKWLIGCGIGCGVLVAIAIAMGVTAVWWMTSPGPQIETEAVIADDSTAIMHFAGDEALAGFEEMAGHVIDEMQDHQSRLRQSELPEALQWIEQMQRMQQSSSADAVTIWIPREITFTFGDSPSADELSYIGAANFKQFVRPVRLMLNSSFPDTTSYAGNKILLAGDGKALCFYDGTFIIASDQATMEQTLDRIETYEQGPEQAPTAISGYEALRGEWPLFGALDNRTGLLLRIADENPDWFADLAANRTERRAILRQVRRATFGFDIDSQDACHWELMLETADEATAAQMRSYLNALVDRLEEKLGQSHLELNRSLTTSGNRIVVTAEISGLKNAISSWVEELYLKIDT